jgi:apolipoprotein N-acyltransferase
MDTPKGQSVANALNLRDGSLLVIAAAISFQLAYSFHACSFLIAVYLWSLVQLTRLKTSRLASYIGLLTGMLTFAPQMNFLWTIFGPGAIALWFVLAFWIRMFLVLGRSCRVEFGSIRGVLLLPFLWTGLEYFRSELYYLRFSWLNAGYVFSDNLALLPIRWIGVYGMGFLLVSIFSICSLLRPKLQLATITLFVAALGILTNVTPHPISIADESLSGLQVAGAQMEFPGDAEVLLCLNKLAKQFPQAQLLVLSEYTFDGPVPDSVKQWCKKKQRYLVVGAKDPVSDSNYYDTAFVIGPTGKIVFRQAKSVPIQFFKDGLPAKEQKLWASPWGNIGFCVCYDLSYSRVIDGLARLGAQAIIVPTMDVADWGPHQHALHARVAPIRAAEYGVPIFRVASSGISQCVNSSGQVTATAPMPGEEAMISGTLHLGKPASLPLDRVVAPVCVAVTGSMITWLTCVFLWRKRTVPIKPEPS